MRPTTTPQMRSLPICWKTAAKVKVLASLRPTPRRARSAHGLKTLFTKECNMKRLHVHVAIDSLADSIQFYSTLFGRDPTVREVDYAKWILEDPRVNFAISNRGAAPGLDHLGLQMETDEELRDVASRLAAAGRGVLEEKNAACCYARGDKAWVLDPQGIRWESF